MSWLGTKDFTQDSYYNYDDMNRESSNISYLQTQLALAGYPVTLPSPVKSNYLRTDFPTVSSINGIRANIKALVDGFYPVTAPVITIDLNRVQTFDSERANALEQNIHQLQILVDNLQKAYKRAGTFAAGQDIIL